MTKGNTKEVGNLGEMLAAKFLEGKGFEIVGRNYKRKYGEVDIIAKKGNSMRFVEVKSVLRSSLPDVTRENNGYRPEELVHPLKLKKIGLVANAYMAYMPKSLDFQIDVVVVFIDRKRRVGRCRFIENVN